MINIKTFLGLNYYTSELDEFLTQFNRQHKHLSRSQMQEKEKYARIYQLRDKTETLKV